MFQEQNCRCDSRGGGGVDRHATDMIGDIRENRKGCRTDIYYMVKATADADGVEPMHRQDTQNLTQLTMSNGL